MSVRGARAKERATDEKPKAEQFRGWLLKWTNYIKGYQKRWFVLNNGLLSYYRTQEEMAHTCRGTINLAGAIIDTIDATHFVITNGPSQVFHLRALNEIERQRWVTALELAKTKAIKKLEDNSDDESEADQEGWPVAEKLKELTTTRDLVRQKHHELNRALAEVELGGQGAGPSAKLKETTAMFKITADAMTRVADEFTQLCQASESRWQRALQHERNLRLQLEESLEALAKQMHGLEREARRASQAEVNPLEESREFDHSMNTHFSAISLNVHDPRAGVARVSNGRHLPGMAHREMGEGSGQPLSLGSEAASDTTTSISILEEEDEDEDDQFFDAPEATEAPLTPGSHRRSESAVSVNDTQQLTKSESESLTNTPATSSDAIFSVRPSESFLAPCQPTILNRRETIPPRPNVRVNLWSIMKNCIGKELSKIPMPVHFSEPISFLQRITEDLTYHQILDNAAACTDSRLQAAHVAAFACSSYATTAIRTTKPFNPMLGETYECDRRAEFGWRSFVEQVSHHPPMLAMHAENKEWTFWQEYTLASKFRGKYLQCFPIGCVHLLFHRTGNHYTWNKVVTTIQNIIVGRLWVDQSGDMTILNHTTHEKCVCKYHAYSYFSRERQKKVTGQVYDAEDVPRYVIRGHWDEYLECSPILAQNGKELVTGPSQLLWKVRPCEPGSELRYNFSKFTSSLNEMEEGIPITDSRNRPDQRVMENGDFDEANRVKVLLEEKQRARRRAREALQAEAAEASAAGNHSEAERLEQEAAYSPVWFRKEYDTYSNTMMYVYTGGYWEGKAKGNFDRDLVNIFET